MNSEYLERLIEVEQREKSNTKRLDSLEPKVEDIHELTSSVKVLATEMKRMREDQMSMDERIKSLEDKPSKRFDSIITIIITAVISGIIAFLFTYLGLK